MNVSCLIPCYNERERIAKVLDIVVSTKYVQQVICVDDGSTDGTADYIEANWPTVEVIRLLRNHGKTKAIKQGLQYVDYATLLMMDADLQGLRKEELEAALDAYKECHEVDMIIMRRINSPWFVKWYRSDVLLSGERILQTADLKLVLRQRLKCYQLEVAINRYMLRHKKVVRWMPWSAINTYKVDKLGVLDGSRKEFNMYIDIVNYVGFSHMCLQLASFTKKLHYKSVSNPTKEPQLYLKHYFN
ncbi:glycosyltransferase family 2 protein [Pontibacter sp. BT310]|uniref:Glycosyltransferase family 2 protein n=1 Tax=Pontibacter populi TaxID=890055 RepID=A0ABS6XFF4_9BACT|nr:MULTISPECIES: glycosyltransferase family 2 protein [Pontibacter]MBJ6119864.1 glycosyltransferase family 2 protein [Pontibacter sp. BT310]MBR0572293.1 glycosyltransferase family 2 protein [Microvirga sp. STS03]MBW3366717.1 glycosyltransferase family 2 protein [Pontibacter populi]